MKLTTANIADNLCLPAKTLDYYLKKDTGETIGRYVRELVYREAEELLIRSELSIRNIIMKNKKIIIGAYSPILTFDKEHVKLMAEAGINFAVSNFNVIPEDFQQEYL